MFGRIRPLPQMALTDLQPCFYDIESKSTVDMVSKFYKYLQNFVDDYNKFVVDINTEIEAFENSTNHDIEQFKCCVQDLMSNYIESIDTKINQQNLTITERFEAQDQVIQDAVDYMTTNLQDSINTLLQQLIEDGDLTVIASYDPNSEALSFIVTNEENNE